MLRENAPIYHGKRNFLGLKDLMISFFTEKCQSNCSFCELKSRSSNEPVSEKSLIEQTDWIFSQYEEEIAEFKQLSIGNEGSILDRNRFFEGAMKYVLERAKEMTELEVLSLETRPEYIRAQVLEDILKQTHAKIIDVTVGFETQDDNLRNITLNKNIKKGFFERKVELIASMNMRLTSYVMLKPGPYMTEEEGISEAVQTIEYLNSLCTKNNTDLVIYFNPTYVANGSSLAREMRNAKYEPPKIQSVLKTILLTKNTSVPIYTGLWSENLTDEKGEFSAREDYSREIRNSIKQFNKDQDYSKLERFRDILM